MTQRTSVYLSGTVVQGTTQTTPQPLVEPLITSAESKTLLPQVTRVQLRTRDIQIRDH